LLAVGVMMGYSSFADRRYLQELEAEIAQLGPQAQRAAALDRQITSTQTRARLLDQFHNQTKSDLDALNELTKLVEPPAWTSSIQITRDTARIAGEAPQAAPLLKLIDSSPLFQNSEFQMMQRVGTVEGFQIRTSREKRP
jgi:hypothetical protein